jgi:hypothetical protein
MLEYIQIWAMVWYAFQFSLSYQNTLNLYIIQWLLEIMFL